MSSDLLSWAPSAPSSGPGVWDSFYHGTAPQTHKGPSLPSLSQTKYLCSLGTMRQGFEIPQKMEPRTGPRLSCPFRLPGGLLGQLTVVPGPRSRPVLWAAWWWLNLLWPSCPLWWCWGLFSGPSLLPNSTERKAATSEGEEGTKLAR